MKVRFLLILVLFLLYGCSRANFCVNEGKARFSIPFELSQGIEDDSSAGCQTIYLGMPKEKLLKVFAGFKQKAHLKKHNQEWVTFYIQHENQKSDCIILHLVDGKLKSWRNSAVK